MELDGEEPGQFGGCIFADGPVTGKDLAHVRLAAQDRHQIYLPHTMFFHQVFEYSGRRGIGGGVDFFFVLQDQRGEGLDEALHGRSLPCLIGGEGLQQSGDFGKLLAIAGLAGW